MKSNIRIAHLADIHWRGLSRHEEYLETFEKFYKSAKDHLVDYIFIAGDIFHTKTAGISPEFVSVMNTWLTKLADVAPVHMMLGNHDGNIVNLTRMDAISPIVEALNNPRICLYKKSGWYKLTGDDKFASHDGVWLYIYSLFDQDSWNTHKAPFEQTSCFTIGCYHGPVDVSKTDVGWAVDGHVTTDYFNDYDIALLGDIHKRQCLDYVASQDGIVTPRIAYPGSFIQQNHGESINEHGYYIWDITGKKNFSAKFVEIATINPFVTLYWDDVNGLSDYKKYPAKSRFRVLCSSRPTQSAIQTITNQLKRYGGLEVAFKIEDESQDEIKKVELSSDGGGDKQTNIRSVNDLHELLRNYDEKSYSKFDRDLITHELKNCIDQTNNVEINTGNWTINKLEFDNLFCYGGDNKIDFNKLNGIVGVFGRNRIGKSSIVGAITYALYNSSDRGSLKNISYINVNKQECGASAIVTCSNGVYALQRKTRKIENQKRGIVGAPTTLELYSYVNDELVSLSAEQRSDTDRTLRTFIGTGEDFALTALSAQGDMLNFINIGSAARKAIVTRCLGLNIFETYHATMKSELQMLKAKSGGISIDELKKQITTLEHRLNDANREIEECESQKKSAEDDVLRLSIAYAGVSNTAQTILERKRLTALLETAKRQLAEVQEQLTAETAVRDELKKKIEVAQSVVDKYNIDTLTDELKQLKIFSNELANLKSEKRVAETSYSSKKKNALKLSDVPCGGTFPSCMYIKDAVEDSMQLTELAAKIEKLQTVIETTAAMCSDEKESEISKKIKKRDELARGIASANVQLSKSAENVVRHASKIDSLNEKIAEITKQLAVLSVDDEHSKDDEAALKLKNELEAEKSKVELLQKRLVQIIQRKAKDENTLRDSNDKLISELDVSKRIGAVEFLMQAFSKKGLPAYLMRSKLHYINRQIAGILAGNVDFTIELEFEDEASTSLEAFINYNDSKRIIELCSGMEKTIASIAIRVALHKVSVLPKPDFFIIDEGFGTLDEIQLPSICSLLSSLRNSFRFILVISHVDAIKDIADQQIEVTKDEQNNSYVQFS